jgi:hypothetical protein
MQFLVEIPKEIILAINWAPYLDALQDLEINKRKTQNQHSHSREKQILLVQGT